jgi:hypothetical protein
MRRQRHRNNNNYGKQAKIEKEEATIYGAGGKAEIEKKSNRLELLKFVIKFKKFTEIKFFFNL